MKKSKRIISYLLALIMLLLSFSGCSSKKDENAEALSDAVNNLNNYVFKKNAIDLGEEIDNILSINLCNSKSGISAVYLANIPEKPMEAPAEGEVPASEGETAETLAEGEVPSVEGETAEALAEGGEVPASEGETAETTEEGEAPESQEENAPKKYINKMYVFSLDNNANATKKCEILVDVNIRKIKQDDNGNLIAISDLYDEVAGTNVNYLSKYDSKGNEIFKISLTDIANEQNLQGDYFYIQAMVVTERQIIISTNSGIIRMDLEGNLIGTIPTEKIDSKIRNFQSMMLTENQELYVVSNYYGPGAQSESGSDSIVAKVDPDTFKVLSKEIVGEDSFYGSMFSGEGADAWMSTSSMITKYNLETNKSTKIMDFVASNVEASTPFSDIIGITDEAFYGVYSVFDTETWEETSKLFYFTHIPIDEIPDKKIVNVGVLYMDFFVRNNVYAFNESSLKYKVNLIDYSSLYKGSNEEILKQINKDASSGKLPDILIVDPAFPVDVYINKGLLEDINPFIENDDEVDSSDMFQNINDAYSVEGKLYQLVPSFRVETMEVKNKFVDGKTSWNIKEAYNFWKEQGFDKIMAPFIYRGELMTKMLSCTKDSFIDWDNGTCNFETEDFYILLDYLKHFPESYNQNASNDEFENVFVQFRKDKALSYCGTLYSLKDYNYSNKSYFGEKVNFIGYPSSNGNGSVIVPQVALAMNHYSECKDGAWEFMKSFFTDAELKELAEVSFPNSRKMFNYLAKKEMESTEVEEIDLGGETVKIDNLSKEDVDFLINYLESLEEPYRIDLSVVQIFTEESAAYFEGKKTAEQVAKVIQSRISLYLAESR